MRTALIVLVAAPLAFAAQPAQAQRQSGDPMASAAIARGGPTAARNSCFGVLAEDGCTQT